MISATSDFFSGVLKETIREHSRPKIETSLHKKRPFNIHTKNIYLCVNLGDWFWISNSNFIIIIKYISDKIINTF